jgi:hypothetical protein
MVSGSGGSIDGTKHAGACTYTHAHAHAGCYVSWAMVHSLTVEFGDEVLLATGQTPAEFSDEARFLLAAKLYELGRLSSAQAAKLCGTTRVAFLVALPGAGVTASNLSAADAEDEQAFARNG